MEEQSPERKTGSGILPPGAAISETDEARTTETVPASEDAGSATSASNTLRTAAEDSTVQTAHGSDTPSSSAPCMKAEEKSLEQVEACAASVSGDEAMKIEESAVETVEACATHVSDDQNTKKSVAGASQNAGDARNSPSRPRTPIATLSDRRVVTYNLVLKPRPETGPSQPAEPYELEKTAYFSSAADSSGRSNEPAAFEGAGPSNEPAAFEGAGPSNEPAAFEGAGPSNEPAAFEGAGPSNEPATYEGAGPSNEPPAYERAGPSNENTGAYGRAAAQGPLGRGTPPPPYRSGSVSPTNSWSAEVARVLHTTRTSPTERNRSGFPTSLEGWGSRDVEPEASDPHRADQRERRRLLASTIIMGTLGLACVVWGASHVILGMKDGPDWLRFAFGWVIVSAGIGKLRVIVRKWDRN